MAVADLESANKANGPWVLLATSSGLGKRVSLSEFRLQGRGGQGVLGIKIKPPNSIVNVHVVYKGETNGGGKGAGHGDDDGVSECLVASQNGMMSRIALNDISVYGRSAAGLRIVKLAENDLLSSITPCKY